MLAGLWLAYSSFGLVSGGIPPLIGPVSADLGLSRSAMGSILGAWPLVYIAMAIPAGAIIDRFGLRRTLAAGIVLVALSGFLRAIAVNHATLFLAVAVFGFGGPFISIGAPKLIATRFSQRDRGTAMGIYMTASSVGRIAALATANSVFMPLFGSSWRLTLASYAGVASVASVIWWLLARDTHPSSDEKQEPASALATSLKVFPVLLRIRVVQLILVMSVGSFLFGHGLSNWLPEILREGGMTASEAGFWAAMPVVVGVGATLVIPRLATPSRRIPMLVVVLLAAGASVLMVGTMTGVPLTLALLLQGAAGRGVMPIIMLTLMDAPQVGAQRMGAAAGLYFTAGEVGGVLGPLSVGVVADLTGGFLGGLLMLTSVSFALAVLAVVLGFALKATPKDVSSASARDPHEPSSSSRSA
jgi:cyanate permease